MEDFAVITIVCCAPLGTLLLTKVGSRLLSSSKRTCMQCLQSQSSREELNRSSASVISAAEARDGALAASGIHSANGNTFAATPSSNQMNLSSSMINCSNSNHNHHNHHNHHSNGSSWRRPGTSSVHGSEWKLVASTRRSKACPSPVCGSDIFFYPQVSRLFPNETL